MIPRSSTVIGPKSTIAAAMAIQSRRLAGTAISKANHGDLRRCWA